MGVLKSPVTHLFQAIYRRPYAKKRRIILERGIHRGDFFPTPNKWKTLSKALVVCCIKGIILPSYVGITLSKYKDPDKPIITMFWTLLNCCEMSFSEILGVLTLLWRLLKLFDIQRFDVFFLWNFDAGEGFRWENFPDASRKTWTSSTLRRMSNPVR